MSSWWLLWMISMLVLLVPSLSYGWGYRGWGPPYPRYIQRRRWERANASGDSATFNHQSWGVGGDLVWTVLFIGLFWAGTALMWR